MGATKRLGRWLLYGACVTPALLMLAYYWLEYVPAQHEYFMNLRFRTLEMIGDQLNAKIGGLASSFDYATKSLDRDKYFSAQFSDLNYHYEECASRSSSESPVEFGNTNDSLRFRASGGCVIVDSASQIFSSFAGDELFDDVVVADKGRVVYQQSTSSPRIATLNELLKSGPAANNAPKTGSGFDADVVRPVRLDDSDFMLLVQPVAISLESGQPVRLLVGGLVRSARLAAEAHHVPPKYLLVLFTPVLVILLSGPCLKILLLTRTGRLAFRDLALLTLSTMVAAGLVTILMASWHRYSLSEGTEPDLGKLAMSVNGQLASNVERLRSAIEQFDEALPSKATEIQDRTDISADQYVKDPPRFDFVFWTNADGYQVAKWTTKPVNTGRVEQKPFDYFRNLAAENYWWSNGQPFTLQALVSPTTSKLIVIVGICSRHFGVRIGSGKNPSPILSAAIVTSLPLVNAPLLPPGAGFAVFDPDGRVLFHSSPERDLHEDFFEEIHPPDQVRAGITMRAGQSLSTYYRGREYQFQIQPVTGLAGVPWNIAVFRELEPRQAMIGLVSSETLILFGALLCLMALAFLLCSSILWVGRGWPWRQHVDFYLAWVWPDPARRQVFQQLARVLAAMLIASVIVVSAGWRQGYRSAGWLLPFSFLLPLAAAAVAAFWLRKPNSAHVDLPPTGQKQPAYIASLTLLLILLAVVPVAGLFGVCDAYETRLNLMHWQRELLNSVETRQAQMAVFEQGSQALNDYVAEFWGTTVENSTDSGQPIPSAWWQDLLAKIRPQVEEEAMETGALTGLGAASSGQWYLGGADGQSLALHGKIGQADLTVRSALPAINIPSDPLWWVVALALLVALYIWDWRAFGRLFNLDFLYTPLPTLSALGTADNLKGHLLVLGTPLVRKDEAVRQWLRSDNPPRVNLYEQRFSYNWLHETLERLRSELTPAPVALQAAAAGGAVAKPVRAAPAVAWVHISNLEAKLGDADDRNVVADLLEKLVLMDVDGKRVQLVVTSAVDPVFHFDSVLSDERKKIYEHPLPEPELQRLARILHNFLKVQGTGPLKRLPECEASPAVRIVYEECRQHHALLEVGEEVVRSAPAGLSPEALLARVGERAQALYKLLWATCTRPEKLLLIQLAQTGLVNPLCGDTLVELIRKGLILPGPPPRIMNETFQRFLKQVEANDTVREWEGEAGESPWLIVRNVVVALLALGLVVLALTQQPALQTATAVLTGVGTVLAGLFRVFGFFSKGRAPNQPGSPN